MSQFSIIEQWAKNLPLQLPALWQVLYYEGMHGNHILFSPRDVEHFEQASLPTALVNPVESTVAAALYLRLINTATFRDLTQWIDGLAEEQRRLAYRLYKQWLAVLRARLVERAH